ncbi:MAG: hypothetical protein J1F35_05855 [Erysipelotrichales bacterium]|nr:hypothetical protein [Erysipelotrichales bacterium]
MKVFKISTPSNEMISYGSFSTSQAKKKAKELSKIFGKVTLYNVTENRIMNY